MFVRIKFDITFGRNKGFPVGSIQKVYIHDRDIFDSTEWYLLKKSDGRAVVVDDDDDDTIRHYKDPDCPKEFGRGYIWYEKKHCEVVDVDSLENESLSTLLVEEGEVYFD